MATAAASVGLFAPSTQNAHLLGWFLGSVVTIFFIALYRVGDRKASASPWYSPRQGQARLAVAVLVIGFACAALHAYYYAHGAAS